MASSVSSSPVANSSTNSFNGFFITAGFAFWLFYFFNDLLVSSSFVGLNLLPSVDTLLTLLLLVPLLSIVLILLRGSSTSSQQYQVGLRSTALSFLFTLRLWVAKNKLSADFEGVFTLSLLPSRALPIRLGVDGLSLPLLVLTNAFLYLCILSLNPSTPRIREALLHLIFLQWAVLGTFLALDFLAFFVFFERTLIPIYFLVLLWGSRERRVRAGYRISLYTLFGSIFRLFTILALLAKAGTTDYGRLLQIALSTEDQRLLWILLFLAFATKIPLFPLHIWLPEAHVEAPTIGSVLLAVVLLKLGTYGLLRFALPLFPEGTVYWSPLVSVFAVRGILYTSLTAIRQIDLKKIIAYSSVGHRNLVLLGRRSGTREGLQGAIFQRLSHGVVSGGLFFGVGVLYERYGVRSLKYYGGRAHLYPLFTRRFLLLSLANISFPLTSSFVGEFLLFLGIFQHSLWATVAAATSRVLGAAYTLWAFNRIFFGNLRTLSIDAGQDLTRKEFALFAPLAALVLWRGVAPSTILSAFLVDCEAVLTQARVLFFLQHFVCRFFCNVFS